MPSPLEEYLCDIHEHCDLNLLPVCHTTSEYNVEKILSDQSLKPEKKYQPEDKHDHFKGEELLYFFYGRAQFIPRRHQHIGRQRILPATFVFNLEKLHNGVPKRLVPFDSGGFLEYGLEVRNIHDYVLHQPAITDIKKYVHTLYGSNSNYLKRKLSDKLESNTGGRRCYIIEEIRNLHDSTATDHGEQACTIELQYEYKEHIQKIWCLPDALVVPLHSFSTDTALDKLRKHGISSTKIIPYSSHPQNYKIIRHRFKAEDLYKPAGIMLEYAEMMRKVNTYIHSRISSGETRKHRKKIKPSRK